MFRSAIVKLTTVYVVLTMVLSLIFSFVFYHFATHELSEGLNSQFQQLVDFDHDNTSLPAQNEFSDRSNILKKDLIYFNLVVLGGSIGLGFFLAKRTLKPIEETHNQQLRFTAEASHELRTPITAMKADTESILLQKHPSYRQLEETLQNNLKDIDRLQALTEHLLYMGKFKFTKPVNGQITDLKEALNGVTNLLNRQQKDKNRLKISCPKGLKVKIDPTALEQLLTIVVDNAYKYSLADQPIKINAEASNEAIVIKVIDEGIGISVKDMPHIFEHFYRSSSSEGPNASGYGLGLPLAKDIAEHYGGSIVVTSLQSKGTTVTIKLKKA